MKHGEQRNARFETTFGPEHTLQASTGAAFTAPLFAVSETVSERWCATCGAWVEARGIIGGLVCQRCYTAWHPA